MIKPYQLESLRNSYPEGTRVELQNMEGELRMPRGLQGTVTNVDDIGDVHVNWDNGSTLALCPEVDSFKKLPAQEELQSPTMQM